MLDNGSKIIAGISLGKGGQEIQGVPIYDTVKKALAEGDV
jgi:succinyl-CoA synthetase alpha subunit